MANEILLLLAEDEPLILSPEAMAIVESRFADLAGIITDIRLGGGPTGWDVATRARELKPEIAIVYATADSAHDWPSHGVPKSVVLQKPYAAAQLITAVSTLLNQAQTGIG